MPHTVPKRVSSTSCTIWLSSADQNETPAAFAPWSTIPAALLRIAIPVTASRTTRNRCVNRSDASRHSRARAGHAAERPQPDDEQEEDRADAIAIAPY